MNIGTCSGCGIPKRVATKHEWRNDGIIVSRESDLRGIWIESGLLHAVLDGIAGRLGVPIDHIVIDTKRRDAKLYVENLLKGAQGRLLGVKPLRRAAYVSMIRQAAALGLASAHLLEYRPGKQLVLRTDQAYHDPLFTADTCGAFEAIEGIRALPSYGRVGKSTFVVIEAFRDASDDERLQREDDHAVPSQASFSRCATCHLPLDISAWKWDMKNGNVTDTNTGEWIIFMNIGGFNAVFRELERELGEDIPGLATEFCRTYYLGLKESRHRSPFNDLSFMKPRGFGVPERDDPTHEELAAGITIRNPFNAPIVAGMVAAVYGDSETVLSWKDAEPGVTTIRLS